MILTVDELNAYRACVGLQVHYAQMGDTHKVMDLQIQLEGWIKGCAEVKIRAYGVVTDIVWSDHALVQYRKLCAEAMQMADVGFAAWKEKQLKIEQWVSDYIQQGVFQATIKIKS